MKTYVPDPEYWARYFDKGNVPDKHPAGIEAPTPRGLKSATLHIEAVTPVERENERVESELRRMGAFATPSKERTRKRREQVGRGGPSDRKLKRISTRDTSGF